MRRMAVHGDLGSALPAGAGHLREVLRQPDAVLFVGAGVSCWSGLPTWPELIAELADHLAAVGRSPTLVRRELERNDLLQAASFGFDVLTPQERSSFVREACRHGVAAPSALHARLADVGPRCFITTNYDTLLEQALRRSRPDTPLRVVNNTQLVETASIIQSRSRDFVFKPHGDVDAADSVILTREQYRALHGEKRHVLEALKTLLVSRPVVFVGFGLRDPDFLLIKDTLATIYQGAAQDHHAIVPDAEPDELAYWRNHYGIHLVSYATQAGTEDPAVRHGALLTLLSALAGDVTEAPAAPKRPAPDATLTILRHARRIEQLAPSVDGAVLPMSASIHRPGPASQHAYESLAAIEKSGRAIDGLCEVTGKLLLTGAPGAGKSFVARSAAARMAEAVIARALQPDGDVERIPTYVDLRDYTGDLWALVNESFPVGFPLERLVAAGQIAFFLDGLNEVPARHVEDNTLHADLAGFLGRIGSCSAVLLTRFGEEHAELELPEVALAEIPREYVVEQLERSGVPATEISEELVELLQRPVFFRFVIEHRLTEVRTPHGVYAALLARTAERCRERFGDALDFGELFGELAFDCVETGDQLIPVAALTAPIAARDEGTPDPGALVNWLVADGLLIPRRGDRVSFFHHSVVEHLAACHLAESYRRDPATLRRCLQARRWDHAILLTLGFLDPAEQQALFDEVMAADAMLGLRALAYVESDWERWTAAALRHLATSDPRSRWRSSHELAYTLEGVRIGEQHEPLLLELAAGTDRLAGTAMGMTVRLGGRSRLERALEALFEPANEYECCWAIAEGLAGRLEPPDYASLLARLAAHPANHAVPGDVDEAAVGLVAASGARLHDLPLHEVVQLTGPPAEAPWMVRYALLEMLEVDDSREGVALTAELLACDPERAVLTLFDQVAGREPMDVRFLARDTVGPQLLTTATGEARGAAMGVLQTLCAWDDAWKAWTAARAGEHPPGVLAAMLHYVSGEEERCFVLLAELAGRGTDWSAEPLAVLSNSVDMSWAGHEALYIALLREGDLDLARSLLDHSHDLWEAVEAGDASAWQLGDLGWWIRWLAELPADEQFLRARLGQFVGVAGSTDRKALLELFERGEPAERSVLARVVLGHVRDLALRDLTPTMLQHALEDLRTDGIDGLYNCVLGSVATEELVERTLLPLLADADEPLRAHLVKVIDTAGSRHRRRYLTTSDDALV